MARNLVGVFRPGSSAAAARGGTAMTTASSATDGDDVVGAEFQPVTRSPLHREFAQLMAECARSAPLLLQQLDGGLDQHGGQAVAGDQRPAGLPAREQRFAHHRAGKPRRTLGRIDIERREQQWLHQPM